MTDGSGSPAGPTLPKRAVVRAIHQDREETRKTALRRMTSA